MKEIYASYNMNISFAAGIYFHLNNKKYVYVKVIFLMASPTETYIPRQE